MPGSGRTTVGGYKGMPFQFWNSVGGADGSGSGFLKAFMVLKPLVAFLFHGWIVQPVNRSSFALGRLRVVDRSVDLVRITNEFQCVQNGAELGVGLAELSAELLGCGRRLGRGRVGLFPLVGGWPFVGGIGLGPPEAMVALGGGILVALEPIHDEEAHGLEVDLAEAERLAHAELVAELGAGRQGIAEEVELGRREVVKVEVEPEAAGLQWGDFGFLVGVLPGVCGAPVLLLQMSAVEVKFPAIGAVECGVHPCCGHMAGTGLGMDIEGGAGRLWRGHDGRHLGLAELAGGMGLRQGIGNAKPGGEGEGPLPGGFPRLLFGGHLLDDAKELFGEAEQLTLIVELEGTLLGGEVVMGLPEGYPVAGTRAP